MCKREILVLIASVSSECSDEYAQSLKRLCCSHTQSIDVIKDSDQNLHLSVLHRFYCIRRFAIQTNMLSYTVGLHV